MRDSLLRRLVLSTLLSGLATGLAAGLATLVAGCGSELTETTPDDAPLNIGQSNEPGCPADANRPGGALRCSTVANFTEIATGQRCPNWCWAASSEMLVRSQGIVVAQEDFVRKIFGPSLPCLPSGNFDNIVRAVSGTYPKKGGGAVQLAAAYHLGVPTNIDAMIASITDGRPFVFGYAGHALVAYGVTWVQAGSARQLREILMIDPYFPYGSPKYRRFRVGVDDARGINGTMELLVR